MEDGFVDLLEKVWWQYVGVVDREHEMYVGLGNNAEKLREKFEKEGVVSVKGYLADGKEAIMKAEDDSLRLYIERKK